MGPKEKDESATETDGGVAPPAAPAEEPASASVNGACPSNEAQDGSHRRGGGGGRDERRQGRGEQEEIKRYTATEHRQSVEDVSRSLGTHVNVEEPKESQGLIAEEAKARLERDGKNELKPKKKVPEIVKFLLQFTNLLMVLLLVATALTYLAYGIQIPHDTTNVVLASILLGVITLTCFLSYWQEHATESVMNSLLQLIPTECAVIRDGAEMRVPATELVVGDLVRLGIGSRVPADLRIVVSNELKVETSSLTGESDAIGLDAAVSQDEAPNEARNLAFMSSLVMTGEGWGVVIRTGDDTMIGSIASLATATRTEKSTLHLEVKRFAIFIACLAAVTGIVFFVVAITTGSSFAQALVTGLITVLVANVPEGLPATVTTQLTVAADRMRKEHVLVKRMDMIETLGSVTVIASDKTGTLMQNRMTVENLWVDGQLFPAQSVSGAVSMAQVRKAQERSSIARVSRRPTNRQSMTHLVRTSMRREAKGTRGNTEGEADIEMPRLDRASRGAPSPSRVRAGEPSQAMPDAAAVARRVSMGRRSVMTGEGALRVVDEVPSPGPDSPPPPGRGVGRASIVRPSMRLGRLSMRTARLLETLAGVAELREGRLPWGRSTPLERLMVIGCLNNEARVLAEDEEGRSEGDRRDGDSGKQGDGDGQGDREGQGPGDPGTVKLSGNATDQGILRYCMGVMDVDSTNRQNPITFRLPFNSVNKFAAVVCNAGEDDTVDGPPRQLMLMKGAPEYVIKRCDRYLSWGNEVRPMNEAYEEEMMAAYERCGLAGERVIGLAFKHEEARNPHEWGEACKSGEVLQGFVFTGLISLVDPPKVGVMEAVLQCRTAGIRVVMVTGDHPLTAEAIARKVGIITKKTPAELSKEDGRPVDISDERARAVVIPGSQIVEMTTEEQWDAVLTKDEIVFARTTPQQKLEIVSNLQRLKEVVAVTGDGVNDSPALKRAQVGVAMGSPEASDVARDAASVILLDDNFASIVTGIREGRILFDNLVKTVTYTVTHLVPELVPVFLTIAFGFPLGITGLGIILIDLITEQAPAISLAYEPAEASVMERPPRDMKRDRLASWPVIRYAYLIAGPWQAVLALIAYLIVFWEHNICIADYVAFSGTHHFQPQPHNNRPFTTRSGLLVTGADQSNLLGQAQAAWWLTIIFCQAWHIWICKTRFVPITWKTSRKHFRNPVTWLGIAIELFVIFVFIYVPKLNSVFQFTAPPPLSWIMHFGFPLFMLPLTEYAKYKAIVQPNSPWARWIPF